MFVDEAVQIMKEPLRYFLERTTPFGAVARFHRERQLKGKMGKWARCGSRLPMPNFGKQRVVIQYIREFSPAVFIETGTYKGKMVYAVLPHIEQIYSIELDRIHFQKARSRFSGYPGIHIIQGQSGQVLPSLLENIDKPCLFWLDAHWSGGSTARGEAITPIIQELMCILNHPRAREHVILIDDARLFVGDGDYPTLETLERVVLDIHPSLAFEVRDDIVRIYSDSGPAHD
jgi:hypothetical protein